MDPEIVEMVRFLDPEIVEKVDKSYINICQGGPYVRVIFFQVRTDFRVDACPPNQLQGANTILSDLLPSGPHQRRPYIGGVTPALIIQPNPAYGIHQLIFYPDKCHLSYG